jgi:hypothetical protein
MDITDIPDQISKAFKYSLRSRSTFAISLFTAIAVSGFAYDLLYGFCYIRWHNAKDPQYAWPYFAGLVFFALVVPSTIGVAAFLRARTQTRPFKAGQIGIAIAPFEVFSVAPETLGTANVLQALDIVGTQFFRVVQNTLSEFETATELEFRFLPQYTNITSKREAVQYREKLRATLVIWGSITQRTREPLDIRFSMQADSQTYDFSDLAIERFPMLPLQYFTFLEAAKAVLRDGDGIRARRLFQQARKLGEQLDAKFKSNDNVTFVDSFLAKLPPENAAPAARSATAS